MPLPSFLAKPIFHVIYTFMRHKEGATFPPIRRNVMPVEVARKQEGDPRKPLHYNLRYPKADFLNYICDWWGFVLHGSPLYDLEMLQPCEKVLIITSLGIDSRFLLSRCDVGDVVCNS